MGYFFSFVSSSPFFFPHSNRDWGSIVSPLFLLFLAYSIVVWWAIPLTAPPPLSLLSQENEQEIPQTEKVPKWNLSHNLPSCFSKYGYDPIASESYTMNLMIISSVSAYFFMAFLCGLLDFCFWVGNFPSIKLQGEKSFMSLRTWVFVLFISLCNMFISSWVVMLPVWVIHKKGYLRFGSNKRLYTLFSSTSGSISMAETFLESSLFRTLSSYLLSKFNGLYDSKEVIRQIIVDNEDDNILHSRLCNVTLHVSSPTALEQISEGVYSQPTSNELLRTYDFNLWVFLGNFIIHLIIIECWFYTSHRLLHYPPLYRTIHKIHHIYKAPTAIACIFAHPVEYCFGNVLGVILGPAISNCHPFECAFWMAFAIVSTCGSHSGYSFLGGEEHDLHHQYSDYNFGVSLFMDKLCGTEYENSRLWHRHNNKQNNKKDNKLVKKKGSEK